MIRQAFISSNIITHSSARHKMCVHFWHGRRCCNNCRSKTIQCSWFALLKCGRYSSPSRKIINFSIIFSSLPTFLICSKRNATYPTCTLKQTPPPPYPFALLFFSFDRWQPRGRSHCTGQFGCALYLDAVTVSSFFAASGGFCFQKSPRRYLYTTRYMSELTHHTSLITNQQSESNAGRRLLLLLHVILHFPCAAVRSDANHRRRLAAKI